jgi:Cys-tRNA(Pro) deacylase
VSKPDYPITPAVRFLRDRQVPFEPHQYRYEEHGGTRVGADALKRPERTLVKTLVMQTENRDPLLVLMHGDREVSTRQLARAIGVRSVETCDERTATKHTGYIFGGTSPFGTRMKLPVYVEKTILELPRILINGGKRGFLVEIDPKVLPEILPVTPVEVAVLRACQ